MDADVGWLKDLVRDVPDFPKPGIVFKDLTPLLADAAALVFAVRAIAEPYAGAGITKVVGVEARGFIMAAPVAVELGAGFVPVRKAGKLPFRTVEESYALEYGSDILEVHADALEAHDRVLVVDDVIATGGTAAASVALIERLGATVVGLGFLIELGFLEGRRQLAGHRVVALVGYE
jgi:adenine phosphoribosyltransferase